MFHLHRSASAWQPATNGSIGILPVRITPPKGSSPLCTASNTQYALAEALLPTLKQRLTGIPFAGRFALLFFFLLGSIVFYPYAESSGLGYYAFRVIGAAVVLLTVWAVTFNRHLLYLVLALAIPSILQHFFFHQHAQGTLIFINRLLSIAFDLLIIGIIALHIFKTEEPTSETIFGALCIYLLLGFLFAGTYSAIASRVPDAFYLPPALNLHTTPDRFDLLYFSFGTLTELGTPGITAVAPAIRSVSLLEAIVGVLYMAVLISRLINAYRTSWTATRQGETLP